MRKHIHIHSMAYIWVCNNRMVIGSGWTSSIESCSQSNATAQCKTTPTRFALRYLQPSPRYADTCRTEPEQRNSNELYTVLRAKGRKRGRKLSKQHRQLITEQSRVHFQKQLKWNTRWPQHQHSERSKVF